MKKYFLNWWLLLSLALGGVTVMVSCSKDDDDSIVSVGQHQYAPEVYVYIDKANNRENLDEAGRYGYQAKEWRMEVKNNVDALPDNFRWCGGEFTNTGEGSQLPDFNYSPSREGLDGLRISGSARFSERQMKKLTEWVKQKAGDSPMYLLDLRQESHGFVNGHHVSWYGYINWSNIGKSHDQILSEEEQLFHSLRGKTITAGKISSSNNYVMTNAQEITVNVDSAWTEREAVEKEGWHYLRLTALDHVFPCDKIIDQFLEIYRTIPNDAWVHFHCQAGRGRTTLWMTFFDMLRNPNVPMKDIIYRHTQLGGTSMLYKGDSPTEQPWRVSLFAETSVLVPLLYDYVQDNAATGYRHSWSDWKKQVFNK